MKWKQTDGGEPIDFGSLPPVERMRLLEWDLFSVTVITDGDFDGYVYVGTAWSYNDGGSDIDWMRYPGELITDAIAIAPDYADSTE